MHRSKSFQHTVAAILRRWCEVSVVSGATICVLAGANTEAMVARS